MFCLITLVAAVAFAAPPAGVVTTVAGNPTIPGYWDGPSQDAMFTHPTWLDVAFNTDQRTCDEAKSGEIVAIVQVRRE